MSTLLQKILWGREFSLLDIIIMCEYSRGEDTVFFNHVQYELRRGSMCTGTRELHQIYWLSNGCFLTLALPFNRKLLRQEKKKYHQVSGSCIVTCIKLWAWGRLAMTTRKMIMGSSTAYLWRGHCSGNCILQKTAHLMSEWKLISQHLFIFLKCLALTGRGI